MGAREIVLPLLAVPRCTREVRERSGLHRKSVDTAIRRAVRAGWARCVTPTLRQARLYTLTPLGRVWVREHQPECALAPSVLEAEHLELHAWVQAGRYRRLVLRHLTEPLTTNELRQRILTEYDRIGRDHVRATLRECVAKGLVVKTDSRWVVTSMSEQLRLDKSTAPQRPYGDLPTH